MKHLLIIAVYLTAILSVDADDIKPTSPEIPIFTICGKKPPRTTNTKGPADLKHPLFSVYSVKELIVAKDQKSVMVGLNTKDTKTLEEITTKYNGRLVFFVAGNGTIEAHIIRAPIKDGYIEFKYPEEDSFAEYLRQRFQIAEFK